MQFVTVAEDVCRFLGALRPGRTNPAVGWPPRRWPLAGLFEGGRSMKRWICTVLVVAMMSMSLGCYTMKHTVGSGPQTGVTLTDRQWYLLFGLVPLGRVDSHDMAGEAQNYQVTTKLAVSDMFMNIFTMLVTIQSRKVIVEK